MANKNRTTEKTNVKSPAKPQPKTVAVNKTETKKAATPVTNKPKAEPKKEVAKVAPAKTKSNKDKAVAEPIKTPATESPIVKEEVIVEVISDTPVDKEPSSIETNSSVEQPAVDTTSDILDTPAEEPIKPVAPVATKSAEQLAYEKEAEQFSAHIEETCKFWQSSCAQKTHFEKHDIVSNCQKQGIDVKFLKVNDETTKVTFTKGRTAFSFQSNTIFW